MREDLFRLLETACPGANRNAAQKQRKNRLAQRAFDLLQATYRLPPILLKALCPTYTSV